MDISLSHKLFKNIRNNRWQNDFVEQDKIGRGGFASVYKAKNCFDDQVYAVKKIKLRVNDIKKNFEQEIQRVLDEAKFLAQVNHQNILRYYNSWLEATTRVNRSKDSLRVQLHKSNGFRSDCKKGGSVYGLQEIDSEDDEEEKNVDSDDSPAVIFERPQAEEDHDPTTPSSQPKYSGRGFSELLRKRKQSAAKMGSECDLSPSSFNDESSFLSIKNPSSFRNKPCQTASTKDCATPLLQGETLESVTLFIQAELCSETLEDYIQTRNQLLQQTRKEGVDEYRKVKRECMKEAIVLAKQIISGLSHIHSHKIIHRDLKPSNIFMVDKICKIGDFGLIKKLHSFYPLEASPILENSDSKLKTNELECDDFDLDGEVYEFDLSEELLEELPNLNLQKNFSEPLWIGGKNKSPFEFDDPMTRSVGTRVYASPEQWQADKTNFDQRADIFSLGIILLLLFHPMGTYMEQSRLINESKEGKTPNELDQELPEIAYVIKRMLSVNPSDRPSLDVILHSLKLPVEMHTELSGAFYTKKENSVSWRKKHFKLIGEKLCIFSKKEDKKAEVVYDLSEWKVQIKDIESIFDNTTSKNELENQAPDNRYLKEISPDKKSSEKKLGIKDHIKVRKGHDIITIENPFQLGCAFRGENVEETVELFEKLNQVIKSF